MKNACAVLAILASAAAAGVAAAEVPSVSQVSAFALPVADVVAPELAVTVGGVGSVSPSVAGTRFESIRYRPRRYGRPRYYDEDRSSSRSSGYFQLHGGFFDPKGDVSNAAVFGARIGSSIDGRIQLGLGVDVAHRSDHESAVIGTGTLPGGGTVERRVDLSSVSSNLVPILAFLQVTPAGTSAGGPYVGIAGGYEALFVSAEDFATGDDFDATYDGWGWQLFGGFQFPVTPQARLLVEGFVNGGELDRDVDDPVSGATLREVVSVDGAGARAGLSWSF